MYIRRAFTFENLCDIKQMLLFFRKKVWVGADFFGRNIATERDRKHYARKMWLHPPKKKKIACPSFMSQYQSYVVPQIWEYEVNRIISSISDMVSVKTEGTAAEHKQEGVLTIRVGK